MVPVPTVFGEQVDSDGNIAGSDNPEAILFDVDAETGKVFLERREVSRLRE